MNWTKALPSYRRNSQWHADRPGQCPVDASCTLIPFVPPPSFVALRTRRPGIVRRIHKCYMPVRLPVSIDHRRASLDFPMRTTKPSSVGERSNSRLSGERFSCMDWASDRAKLRSISRHRSTGCCYPPLPTATSPRRRAFSRLNTRAKCAPVNDSFLPFRATTQELGFARAAIPIPYYTFVHDTSPVEPDEQGQTLCRKPPG